MMSSFHYFKIFLVILTLTRLNFVYLLTFNNNFTHHSNQRNSMVSEIIAGHPSPNREFFAHIQITTTDNKVFVCGASVIDEFFVVTAAHCIANVASCKVEVGNFAIKGSVREVFHAVKFYPHELYDSVIFVNDIALIKVDRQIPIHHVIPLCQTQASHNTLLGTCGLGRISTTEKKVPDALMETYFYENMLWRFSRWFLMKTDITKARRIFPDNSICYGDSGSPLYVLEGKFREPQCLYGVVSHYNRENHESCQGKSFFANIPHFKGWIRKTIDSTPRPVVVT